MAQEKEAYDFVYAITEGRREELPSRAFDDERERALVQTLMRDAEAHGYSEEIDRAFQSLADARKHRHPVRTLLIRAANVIQLWITLETNSAILDTLTPVPRFIRRPILGALLLIRIAVVLLALAAAWRAWKRWRAGEADAYDALTLLMLVYIVARTGLIGIVVDWRVHRYMVSAWIPMLWCAVRALSPTPARPTLSNGREAFGGVDRAGDDGAASG